LVMASSIPGWLSTQSSSGIYAWFIYSGQRSWRWR
jgi:hypothetical protein